MAVLICFTLLGCQNKTVSNSDFSSGEIVLNEDIFDSQNAGSTENIESNNDTSSTGSNHETEGNTSTMKETSENSQSIQDTITTDRLGNIDLKAPYYSNGDNVAFIGDSITANGIYINYIYDYFVTRYPKERIKFYNKGVSGDSAGGALLRFETDIVTDNSNKANIMFGMNDFNQGYYNSPEPNAIMLRNQASAKNIFKNNMTSLIKELNSKNIKNITLIESSIMDETSAISSTPVFTYGYNNVIASSKDLLTNFVSNSTTIKLVDFNSRMLVANELLHKEDASATVVSSDRIHPGNLGNWIMAYCYFKDLYFESDVAKVSIDYANQKLLLNKNCGISNIVKGSQTISFKFLPESLPLPASKDYLIADKLCALTDDFNNEIITVNNLPEGKYKLMIDNNTIGSYSAADFSKGINIAVNPQNPDQVASMKINDLLNQKTVYELKLRRIAEAEIDLMKASVDLSDDQAVNAKFTEWKQSGGWSQYMANLYKTLKPQQSQMKSDINNIINRIYDSNIPTEHLIQIIPA